MTATQQTTQQPEVAPQGFYFYLATTPSPTDKGRRYLHSTRRPEKPSGEVRITLSPTRGLAKPFDRLMLARAYADFLNRIPSAQEFFIVLEPGVVLDRPSVPKVMPRGIVGSHVNAHTRLVWE